MIRLKSRMNNTFVFLLTIGVILLNLCIAEVGYCYNNSNQSLLYENTYKNGLSSCTVYEDVYSKVTYGGNIESTLYQGNTGIAMKSTVWPAKTISYTFKNPVSAGIINVSYDTSLLGRDGNQAAHIRLNDSKYVFYMNKDRGMYGPANTLSGYGDTSVTTPYSQNVVYTVNLVYDLTNKKAYTYVNDVLLTQRTIPAGFTISSIDFYLSMVNAYFDNLKIEYSGNFEMKASVKETNVAGNFIDLNFSDRIDQASLTGKNYTVKNQFTGKICSAVASYQSSKVLRLVPAEPLESGYEYLITLPEEIKGILGDSLNDRVFSCTAGEGRYLKYFRMLDVYGNTLMLSEKNPAEIGTFLLQFSEGVSASSALEGLSFCNANGVGIPYTVSANGNEATITLNNYLYGNSVYKLIIHSPNLDIPYEINIATLEGGFKVLKIAFVDDKGHSLSDLSNVNIGDTATVNMEFIKTVPDKISFLASAGLWNGLDMNDYDFKVVSMGAEESSYKTSFIFTVRAKENLAIKAFMWKGLGEINPISEVFTIR